MNEIEEVVVAVEDFERICRVCLRFGEDMEDIFELGMDNLIMEFTNLKVDENDKLPHSVCHRCRTQLDELFRFLQQAKSSEDHLRSLLRSRDMEESKLEDLRDSRRRSPRKRLKKWSRGRAGKKLKLESDSDKMYLIFVPKPEQSTSKLDAEIVIQDLNSDNDNLELSHYCKSIVRNNLSDHTYPKDLSGVSCDSGNHIKPHPVNFEIYQCGECREAFEELSDLTNHLTDMHGSELQDRSHQYSCSVCGTSQADRPDFLTHLQQHKQEGYSFVKVNSLGKVAVVHENEKDVVNDSKVFLVNLDSTLCTVCHQVIDSKESFPGHMETCAPGEYDLKYTCPVCCQLFSNDEVGFVKHLVDHQKEGFFFIKVDGSGQPTEPDDGVYVRYKEAVEVMGAARVFKIIDVNSCDKCEFVTDSFSRLQDHCDVIHGEKLSGLLTFCCPICLAVFSVDETQGNLYRHLKEHKQDGVSFIQVRRNSTMGAVREECSDIFTQSSVLWTAADSGVSRWVCSPEFVPRSFPPKYTCDLCEKQFKKKKEVIAHLRAHQATQESSSFICEKCGKECTGRVSYKKHFLQHSTAGKRPTCGVCNKTFAKRATLNGHMRHHLGEGTGNESQTGIICEKCGKSFSNNGSLTKHKKLHLRDKENAILKCEICDRDFFRQSSFDRHKSAHLNPKYLECDMCKLPLSSVASLQKHLESHRKGSDTFDCKACNLSFLSKDSLTAHQTHTGHYLDRKPLECNVCHEKFFIGKKFTEHIKTHPKYKMGECTLCGKRLSTIQSLMLHMGRHFESNSILCPHCGKQFLEERNYHRHLLTHEGIKPFPCDVQDCKKSFYTLFELNRHKKYHNNTRDFRCPYCSKSFHEANHLTVHVRTHTGERPYTCPHCSKGFVTRTRCKHHIKLVHQGVGYDLIQSTISKKVMVFEAVEAVI